MPQLPKIIGIHGLIHSGKDTVANHLAGSYGYNKAGFADPLKYVCAELFLENPRKFFDEKGKEEVMPFWGITRRAALQFVGTELVREHIGKLTNRGQDLSSVDLNPYVVQQSQDHWIRVMEKRIQDSGLDKIVINDLRFQNEADWVYSKGGWVIHITRNNTALDTLSGGIPNHSSEGSINYQGDKTWLIKNDSTFESLYQQIDSFVNQFAI